MGVSINDVSTVLCLLSTSCLSCHRVCLSVLSSSDSRLSVCPLSVCPLSVCVTSVVIVSDSHVSDRHVSDHTMTVDHHDRRVCHVPVLSVGGWTVVVLTDCRLTVHPIAVSCRRDAQSSCVAACLAIAAATYCWATAWLTTAPDRGSPQST